MTKEHIKDRLKWQRKNYEYTKRLIEQKRPYGLDLLRCWPMRVIRAFANRYGFQVEGDIPKLCKFTGYQNEQSKAST